MKRLTICGLLLCLAVLPASAGSVSISVAQTGSPTLSKTYTVPDAEIVRIISTYQQDANTSVNGTATRVQVLQFWVNRFIQQTVSDVRAAETDAAVRAVVPPTPINPQ